MKKLVILALSMVFAVSLTACDGDETPEGSSAVSADTVIVETVNDSLEAGFLVENADEFLQMQEQMGQEVDLSTEEGRQIYGQIQYQVIDRFLNESFVNYIISTSDLEVTSEDIDEYIEKNVDDINEIKENPGYDEDSFREEIRDSIIFDSIYDEQTDYIDVPTEGELSEEYHAEYVEGFDGDEDDMLSEDEYIQEKLEANQAERDEAFREYIDPLEEELKVQMNEDIEFPIFID